MASAGAAPIFLCAEIMAAEVLLAGLTKVARVTITFA